MKVIFDHEKLEVYVAASEYSDLADQIAAEIPEGHGHLRDQLRRSSDSIVNNIAEGAGEFRGAEKARFYRMSLRSATESAATLHTCLRRRLGDEEKIEAARVLLKRCVEMLTKMIKSVECRPRYPENRDPDRARSRDR